ncbi:MAG: hypothetical protein IJ213_02965 [Bacteroidales bacterium]|nr:hypothetical protein [Bacteroidales bacterium]
MKKILPIIALFLFFATSCSSTKEDEQLIQQTVESFYKNLEKKNYKELKELISVNMQEDFNFIKTVNKDAVKYSSYKVSSISVNGENAIAVVETVDEFDNNLSFVWNLVKIKGRWKMNNYNFSNSTK